MASLQAQFLLSGCDLPGAWQGQPVWRVLDTDFADGRAFFTAWQAWAGDARRPRLLHYVAVAPHPPARDRVLHLLAAYPELAHHAPSLARQWFGLLPGFHRLVLEQGRVLLGLCIGPLHPMLQQQRFVADSIFLHEPASSPANMGWDRWCIKSLARLCRRGTGVSACAATVALRAGLVQAGFALQGDASNEASAGLHAELHGLRARFEPRWQPGHSRHPWRAPPVAASSCVVVGAGLAGATVAAALARRGWQVSVLDTAPQPAAGASGLPVGLLAPQASRDDSARSRISRAGLRLTLQLCHELLQHGEDWALSGVLELRADGRSGLPDHWPAQGRQWSEAWAEMPDGMRASIWHASGGWIKPALLVQACLAQAGVRFVGNSRVHSIAREGGQWLLRDPAGHTLAGAAQLVVAAAGDSVRLLDSVWRAAAQPATGLRRLAPMRALDGQLSWALQHPGDAETFPAYPVNGEGSFVPQVPTQGGHAWFAGATYEPHRAEPVDAAVGHAHNLERLARLLPAAAATLAPRCAAAQVQAWRGTRSTTVDHLPAAGPLDAGPHSTLWVSTGMGSRGLSYAALCAELLAAQLGAEPWPVEARLANALGATRRALLHHL